MLILHQLIHHLSKGEKRYFKVFTSRHIIHGSRHDSELFDAMLALKEYDEEKLKQIIKTPALLKNLNIYKHLLYKQLLRALATYHHNYDVEDEVFGLYKTAKILFDKALYAEALKFIHQGLELSTRHNLIVWIINLKELELHLLAKTFNERKFNIQAIDSFAVIQSIIAKLQNEIAFKEAHSRVFYTTKVSGVRDFKINQKNIKPLENLFKKLPAASTPKAELLKLEIESTLEFVKGNFSRSIELEQKVKANLQLVYPNERMRYDELLSCLVRIAAAHHMNSDLRSIGKVLTEVKKIVELTPNISITKNKLFTNFELIYYINTNKTDKADEMMEIVSSLFAQKVDNFSLEQYIVTHQNLAIYLFLCGRFEDTLAAVQKILNYSARKVAIDIIILARMLELVTNFELRRLQVLKAKSGATKRYILKYRELDFFEAAFLKFINSIAKKQTEKAVELKLKELYSVVSSIKPTGYLNIFPFAIWVEAKFTKKSFASLLHKAI